MNETVAWPPAYKIKRHAMAKSVKLRASAVHGVEITVPRRFSLKYIPEILEEHREWLTARLLEIDVKKSASLPDVIDLQAMNESWKVFYESTSGRMQLLVRPQREMVLLGKQGDKERCKERLIQWLRETAENFFDLEMNKISKQTALQYNGLIIRDQKTLWGSCTVDGTISLNYKLIFLPYPLAVHVMLHELCHTRHHNHSAAFWQLVAKYDTLWQSHKRELRRAEKYIPAWIK